MPDTLTTHNGVTIDSALLHRLMHAQLDHVHAMTAHDTWMTVHKGTRDDGTTWRTQGYDPVTNPRHISDDGYDYLSAALELGRVLLDLWYDDRVEELAEMLNRPTDHDDYMWNNFASDGMCSEITDLIVPWEED